MHTPQSVRSTRAALFCMWCTLRSLRLPTSSAFFRRTLCPARTLSEPILNGSRLLDTILLLAYSIPQVVGASIFPRCLPNSDFLRSGRCPHCTKSGSNVRWPCHHARSLENRSPTNVVGRSSQIVFRSTSLTCTKTGANPSPNLAMTQAEASASPALDVGSLNPPRLHTCTLKNGSGRRRRWESLCGANQPCVKVSPLTRCLCA